LEEQGSTINHHTTNLDIQ